MVRARGLVLWLGLISFAALLAASLPLCLPLCLPACTWSVSNYYNSQSSPAVAIGFGYWGFVALTTYVNVICVSILNTFFILKWFCGMSK